MRLPRLNPTLRLTVGLLLLSGLTVAGARATESAADAAAPRILFRDAAAKWGVRFEHQNSFVGDFHMPETVGSGVVIFDYDGDGDNDLFLIDSGSLPVYPPLENRTTLFRNDAGTMVAVTERAGIRIDSFGMGAAAADIDGDADLDLFVTAFGRDHLFSNQGDGSFVEIAEEAGVADTQWSTSAAFADTDRDGDLDLYATRFVDYTFDDQRICGATPALASYCRPQEFNAVQDLFYENQGDGSFLDATAEAGLVAADGKGLALAFGDIDSDGWPDLYIANDTTPNFLFRNLGDGRFEEIALISGTAVDEHGTSESGMGVDIGDLDADGLPEIMVTNYDVETNAVYSSLGSWIFIDRRYPFGLAEPSMYKVAFGLAFADFDQDRDLDVAVANGHVIHNIEDWGWGSAFTRRQRNQVFANRGGRFDEVEASGMSVSAVSRGLASGDLDGDGDLDVVITNSGGEVEVYENVSDGQGNWLLVDLDSSGPNRHGVGTRLEVGAEGWVISREVRAGSSYMSQNAMTAHFGTAEATSVGVTVHWADGGTLRLERLPVNRRLRLHR